MNVITNETVVRISLGFLAMIFFAFIRSHKDSSVRFEYSAQTLYIHKDHTYRFHLKKIRPPADPAARLLFVYDAANSVLFISYARCAI